MGPELLHRERGYAMKRIFFISCAVLAFAATAARAQFGEVVEDIGSAALFASKVSPGQSLLPRPSQEGNEALDQLLNRCLDEHGVRVARDAGGRTWLVLADPDRVKNAVSANRQLLTPALRDAVVARWNTVYQVRERREGFFDALAGGVGGIDQGRPGEQADEDHQRLGVVLLRAIGEATRDDRALAFSVFLTAQAEERAGDFVAALNDYERARRLFTGAKDLVWEAACLNNLGTVYSEQGEYSRALELLRGAATLGVETLGADHSLVATCQGNMGEVFVRMEDYPQAEECLRKALAIWSKISGEQRPMVTTTLISLGDVYSRQGKDEARSQFERALAMWQEIRGENGPGAGYFMGRTLEDAARGKVVKKSGRWGLRQGHGSEKRQGQGTGRSPDAGFPPQGLRR
jgi:tetratricopeptide (TPR) repeat protein